MLAAMGRLLASVRRARTPRSARASESGQAVVEAAIILPAMIFLLLCALQVTLMQQARIMVEYAAFNAARVGVVRNMDNGGTGNGAGTSGPMRDAAVLSILPTFGRTDSVPNILVAKAKFEVRDLALKALGLPQIKVAVLNPHKADFGTFGKHLNGQEIDFDDARPAAAPATLLSVQVRYLFELKVPFANKMIQTIWFASQLGVLNTWSGFDLTRPQVGAENSGIDAVSTTGTAALGRGTIQDGIPGGLSVSALAGLAKTNRFYLPVHAWYSMRMQSNPYLKWAAP